MVSRKIIIFLNSVMSTEDYEMTHDSSYLNTQIKSILTLIPRCTVLPSCTDNYVLV